MSLDELNSVIADFVQIGFMEAVKAYEPNQDLVRKSEVKGWLKMMLIDDKAFKYLVDKGFIKAIRKGSGKNSPLYYSKKDIKQAISMAKINRMIIKDKLLTL